MNDKEHIAKAKKLVLTANREKGTLGFSIDDLATGKNLAACSADQELFAASTAGRVVLAHTVGLMVVNAFDKAEYSKQAEAPQPFHRAEKDLNDARVEVIAAACHEANKKYCESHGDLSQASWDDAPGWQRDSARQGVRGILSGEITTPEQSHESWLKVKRADGWVFGKVKDAELKTHPCMRPYEDLPDEQQVKDAIFFGTVEKITAVLEIEL